MCSLAEVERRRTAGTTEGLGMEHVVCWTDLKALESFYAHSFVPFIIGCLNQTFGLKRGRN